jgi:hypothetical protein
MLMAVLSIGGITLFLTLFQLQDLLPGANRYELESVVRLNSMSESLTNPFNLPYFLLAKFYSLIASDLLSLRLASATLGIATIALLAYIFRQWFNNRIAVAGTLFVVTSSWYLHLARIGAPFILSAFWLALIIAIGTWRTYTTKPFLVDTLLVIIAALSIYSAYFIWLSIVGIGVLIVRRRKQLYILPRKHQIVLPILYILLISPLIYASVKDINIALALTGLYNLPASFLEYLKQIGQNFSQIFFRGFTEPSLNLGRLAILDIFSVIMVALGILYFERQRGLRRSQLLFSATVFLAFLVSLSPFFVGKLAIFFPIIMLFGVAGIVELLNRWLKSFPGNPVARTVGVCVIVLTIGFVSNYHLQRYFVAWSGNPDVVIEHSN